MRQPRGATKVLFLSALDFKEKSIQVIRKTPEAFRDAGWRVTYLVARDTSRRGDYFYERTVDLPGVRVVRAPWPLAGLQDLATTSPWKAIVSKLRGYLAIAGLAIRAADLLAVERFDAVYGYEAHGYLAACILRFLGLTGGAKMVARFQGFKEKRGLMALLNWEMYLALMLPAHICIMTDDGTQGDKLIGQIGSPNRKNLRFWVNGVDPVALPDAKAAGIRREMGAGPGTFLIVSVSRLVPWKRVDRGIRAVHRLVTVHGRRDLRYLVVGGGSDQARLSALVAELGMQNYIKLVGPLDHERAAYYLQAADAFISAYDLSNVGNPMLEAVRAHKLIFTLDNGDTGKWIRHGENGFIYPAEDGSVIPMAADLDRVMVNPSLRAKIQRGVVETERKRLWTWPQRLGAEVSELCRLVEGL